VLTDRARRGLVHLDDEHTWPGDGCPLSERLSERSGERCAANAALTRDEVESRLAAHARASVRTLDARNQGEDARPLGARLVEICYTLRPMLGGRSHLARLVRAGALGLGLTAACAEVMQSPRADTSGDALVGTVGRRPTSDAGATDGTAPSMSDGEPQSAPPTAPGSDGLPEPGSEPPTAAPTVPPTQPPTAPLRETCNGLDDDANGLIDDLVMCPCDVVQREGHAYLLCAERMAWFNGRMLCEGVGYTLAQVDDAREDAFIFGEMRMRGFGDTWIGLTDQGDEGAWKWSDGTALAYTHWDSGEPNDGGQGGEDCGLIMASDGRASEWDDRPCEGTRTFVCEAAPPP